MATTVISTFPALLLNIAHIQKVNCLANWPAMPVPGSSAQESTILAAVGSRQRERLMFPGAHDRIRATRLSSAAAR
jgi:hypothetical protein